MNLDETELKNKLDHTPYNKVKIFRKNIVLVQEGWFADINLTDGETFPTAIIKRLKHRIKLKKTIKHKATCTRN